jgi:oligosaccharide repeat unit polymerase
VLFLSVWGTCLFLFILHLSEWFDFRTNDVSEIVAWICLPFVLAIVIFEILWSLLPKKWSGYRKDIDDPAYLRLVERRLERWFYCWLGLSLVEVVFSGGLPIVWLLTGNSKVYMDYGLPAIHVFLWALLNVLATAKFGIYLLHGNRRRLFIPVFQIFWGLMIVSRGLIMGALLQGALLWLCLRGIKAKVLFRAVTAVILIVLMFGYIGDVRTGASSFRAVARPTSSYPDWLPSGVLWVYIYATSPLANLVNTRLTRMPVSDAFFSHTVFFMFPAPLRNAFYGSRFTEDQGKASELITPNLSVSSAYVGPYLDYGFIGIGCYSTLLGVLSAYCWKKRKSFRHQLRYVIIGQCLVFSVFWNFLFYTPLLGQIFWIYLIFLKTQGATGVIVDQRHSFSSAPGEIA